MSNNNRWELYKDWKYPYKNGKYRCLSDPKYIKDRDEFFAKNGNGWWWGDGWWNGHYDTVADRQRKYRDRIGNSNAIQKG